MILYTSDTDSQKRNVQAAFLYLLISLVCALFGAIYELYSHEVYSFYMIYAFAFPLVGGCLPFLSMYLLGVKRMPRTSARNLYHSGIATLTIGSVLQGVLDIYGTTNSLMDVYWVVGIALSFLGILIFLTTSDKHNPVHASDHNRNR